jgi:hypothetical protein
MQGLNQALDEPWEGATPSEIIAELAAVVERQLEAARNLNAPLLAKETAQRQDLMFHLRVATQQSRSRGGKERLPLDCESQLNLRRIAALDTRLRLVLESVTTCLGTVLGRGQPVTYGLNGRMRA